MQLESKNAAFDLSLLQDFFTHLLASSTEWRASSPFLYVEDKHLHETTSSSDSCTQQW